jgi:hypothetical protein
MKLQPAEDSWSALERAKLAAGNEPKFRLGLDAQRPSTNPARLAARVGYDARIIRPRAARSRFPLTARREFKSSRDRRVILEKVRSLEANLGLIPRMKGQVGKYSVGRGIFPISRKPSTRQWNEAAATKFDDWANNRFVCDAAGAMTFWERQRFHAETFFGEGESFDVMISSSQPARQAPAVRQQRSRRRLRHCYNARVRRWRPREPRNRSPARVRPS